MILYAESSAILAWLLGESRGPAVLRALESAAVVVSAELTGIECARAMHRAFALGLVTRAQRSALYRDYTAAAAQWEQVPLGDRVALIASAPYPVEPVRALDAVHLASALVAREGWPDLAMLSLDQRVRDNAAALAFSLVPL